MGQERDGRGNLRATGMPLPADSASDLNAAKKVLKAVAGRQPVFTEDGTTGTAVVLEMEKSLVVVVPEGCDPSAFPSVVAGFPVSLWEMDGELANDIGLLLVGQRRPEVHLPEVTEATFGALVLGATKPVIVDFFTDWCGPCKGLAPYIARLADELKEKADVYKLNAESSRSISELFGVKGFPTVMVFWKGNEVGRSVGSRGNATLDDLRALVDKSLGGDQLG